MEKAKKLPEFEKNTPPPAALLSHWSMDIQYAHTVTCTRTKIGRDKRDFIVIHTLQHSTCGPGSEHPL